MRLTEIPPLLSAIAFLLADASAVLGQLQGGWSTLAAAVMTLSWAIFVVDYFVRLHLAEDKRTWFVRNLLDLAIVLLPMLRPLRLLRLVSVLTVFQRIGGTALSAGWLSMSRCRP